MFRHSLIGSRAFKPFFVELTDKFNKRAVGEKCDYDIIIPSDVPYSTKEEKNEVKKYFKSIYGETARLDIEVNDYLHGLIEGMKTRILDEELYKQKMRDLFFTIKASHVIFDEVHKEKTYFDLYAMSKHAEIIDVVYWKLQLMWIEKYGKKWRADFSKESSEFFDDAVSRENVHDQLHLMVAKEDQPAFKFMQHPGQTTVMVWEDLFWEETEQRRRNVVIEEAQALAIERDIYLAKRDPRRQHLYYIKWVKALIERLAPDWMVIYIINNLHYFFNHKEVYYEPQTFA